MALACVAQVVLAEEERQNRNHNKENDLVSTEILVYQVLSFIQNPIFMKIIQIFVFASTICK